MSLPPPCNHKPSLPWDCCCKMEVTIDRAPSGIAGEPVDNVDVACCTGLMPNLLEATVTKFQRDCICDNSTLLLWNNSNWTSTEALLPNNRKILECCDGFKIDFDLFCDRPPPIQTSPCNSGDFQLNATFTDPNLQCNDCIACTDQRCLPLNFTFFPLDTNCCKCCFDITISSTGGPFFTNSLPCCTTTNSLPKNLIMSPIIAGCVCGSANVPLTFDGSGSWGGSFISDVPCCGDGKSFDVSLKCCGSPNTYCRRSCEKGEFELCIQFTDGCDTLARGACANPSDCDNFTIVFQNVCFNGDCCESCACTTGTPDVIQGFVSVTNVNPTGSCSLPCDSDCSGPFELTRLGTQCIWDGVFEGGSGCFAPGGANLAFGASLELFRCPQDVTEKGGVREGNVVEDACGQFTISPGGGSCVPEHVRAVEGNSICDLIDLEFCCLDFDSCCQVAVCQASGFITITE